MNHEMHLYSCENCCLVFAIEAHEEINQSDAVCPICHEEHGIEDAGYGTFTVTIPAEKAT